MKNYVSRLEQRSTWRFMLELTVLLFVTKACVAVVTALLGWDPVEPITTYVVLDPANPGAVMMGALIPIFNLLIQPLIETLIAQALVIRSISFFSPSIPFQIAISAAVFSLPHGFPNALLALPAGVLLAWGFIVQNRRTSFWHAACVIWVIHAIHNVIAMCIGLIAASILAGVNA